MSTPAEHSTARVLWPPDPDETRSSQIETPKPAAAIPKEHLRRA